MKGRTLTALALLSSLIPLIAVLCAVTVAAQGPGPRESLPTGESLPLVVPGWEEDGARTAPIPVLPLDMGAMGASAPAVDVGEPGLSFRHVRSLGEYAVAYLEDTVHLNHPWGVAADGTDVWIAEGDGKRLLKYTNTGSFLMQIGKAGYRYGADGTSLEWLSDVAVDSTGNVWAVDMGSAHVAKFDASGNWVSELGRMWDRGTGNDQFDMPGGIAFDSAGNVYVSDGAGNVWEVGGGNHRVQIFDSSGNYLNTIGVSGVPGTDNGHLDSPCHIAIDTSNRLYVADTGNHRIQIFDVSTPLVPSYMATIGVTGQEGSDNNHFSRPAGVAVDANYIYVADTYNHRVQVFDRITRAYVATIGMGLGYSNEQFNTPSDVAVDAAGHIYVSDCINRRVQQFNNSRAYVLTYGITGIPYVTDGYHYNLPTGVAIAPDGSIYLAEEMGRRLLKLSAAGDPLWVVGEPGIGGNEKYRLSGPQGLDLDGTGYVYVADSWNNRIQVFTSAGLYYATLGTGWGSGTYEFSGPRGVAVDSGGNIYVADTYNHRVQIYNSDRVHVGTLGETGVPGSDNARFDEPYDVDVDAAGNIYVLDHGNHRLQIFDSGRTYLRTIGESGVPGRDFGHLSNPTAVAVDSSGLVYVADEWGRLVHVYDNDGAYRTTIGGYGGDSTGSIEQCFALAVDGKGHLYAAEYLTDRLKEYAPGVPGWIQTNVNGFGDVENSVVEALVGFGGRLYAGTQNDSGNGAQLWRSDSPWSAVTVDGFGNPTNYGISDLLEFSGDLYAATNNWDSDVSETHGGQIWRSADGLGWTQVVSQGFGDPSNGAVMSFAVFSDTLFASTSSFTDAHGVEIWRSSTGDSGDWTQVVSDGLGNAGNASVPSFEVFGTHLYAGTDNSETGAEVWRTSDGTGWTQVNTSGFGDPYNWSIALGAFNGFLYAGTYNYSTSDNPGAELWRCQQCDGSDWQQVPIAKGFGDTENRAIRSLVEFDNMLYAITYNNSKGLGVWRSGDGLSWEQIGPDGLSDSNNSSPYWGNSVLAFDERLYVGTSNWTNGGQLWKKTVTADLSATPVVGPPPLEVAFTNTSSGDYTSSLWRFGDGSTSAQTDPTHTYSLGVYTVSLTVEDGVDTSTVTRTHYIQAVYRVYLPLTTRSYETLLYDNFNDPAFEGSYNPGIWTFSGDNAFQAQQQAGSLQFTTSGAPDDSGAGLRMERPVMRSLEKLQEFEARLRLGSDHVGGWASVQIFYSAENINGHHWYTQCYLGSSAGSQPGVTCNVVTYDDVSRTEEYSTVSVPAAYDTWNTARIEVDPSTARLSFYVDGSLVGSHTPADAAALIAAENFEPEVSVWNGDPGTSVTRYVDDVRITPALP